MKTPKFLFTGILGIGLAGFVLTGCHKDATTSPASSATTNDISAAEDESNASDAMNDSKTISDAGAEGNASKYGPVHSLSSIYNSNCTVKWSKDTGANVVDTMYINFGSVPVECNDYRWRQGEIIVYWNNNTGKTLFQSYFDSSSVITMTFKNYASGSSKTSMIGVAGTRVWTNTGTNALNEENWSFSANLILTYSNNQTATWNSTRTNTLVSVGGVYYYEIGGSATGTDRNGVVYNVAIVNTSPLYITAVPWWLGGCAWIEAGTINITLTGFSNGITINFGNVGDCDATAVATINGNNYTFIMW